MRYYVFILAFTSIDKQTITTEVLSSTEIKVTWQHNVDDMSHYVVNCTCESLIPTDECANDSKEEDASSVATEYEVTCIGLTPGAMLFLLL